MRPLIRVLGLAGWLAGTASSVTRESAPAAPAIRLLRIVVADAAGGAALPIAMGAATSAVPVWMKPETVLKAAKLIRTGQVFELAAALSPDPKEAFIDEGRVFNIYTKQLQPVPNTRSVNEELVVTVSNSARSGRSSMPMRIRCGATRSTIASSFPRLAPATATANLVSRQSAV